jgi:hypothetical protein
VQTFVPYADFARTAAVLDTRRLGKQRVEVIQIVRALTVPGYARASHPAVLMWKGHEEALGRYCLEMCEEWLRRGFDDTCAGTITADLAAAGVAPLRTYGELVVDDALPAWLFDDAVQSSRRRTRCEGAGGEPPSPQRRRQEGLAGSPPGRPARLCPISGRRRPSSRRDARATRARRHG